MQKTVILLLFALVFSTGSAMAGWVIAYDNGVTTQVQEDKVRTDTGDTALIMALDENTLTAVNTASKTYYQGTIETVAEEVDDFFATLQVKLGVDVRQMSQDFDPSDTDLSSAIKIVKQGSGDPIAGFETLHYKVYLGDTLAEEVWIAPALQLFDPSKAKKIHKLSKAIATTQVGHLRYVLSDAYLQIISLGGLPMKRIYYTTDAPHTREVQSVSQEDIPTSAFVVPEGYEPAGYMEVMGIDIGSES